MFEARLQRRGGVVQFPVLNVVPEAHGAARVAATERPAITRDRLETLPERVNELWPDSDVPAGLLSHVVREAFASDLALGESPETWSPLGDVRYESFGRMRENDASGDAFGPLPTRVQIAEPTAAGPPVVEFVVDDEVVSRLLYGRDALVMVVPADTDAVEVEDLDRDGDELVLDGSESDDLMVWRFYTGDNSWMRDAVTRAVDGVHRLKIVAADVGVLVARVVKVSAKWVNRMPGDPLARRRLVTAEARNQEVASSCPVLQAATAAIVAPVVVVHGTMSTGLALAAAARECAGPSVDIRRFEHDTWLPAESNARELADLVGRWVTHRVLFIAHSRGGLVVRHAMDLLTAEHSHLNLSAVTLGTPFHGTPSVTAAKVAFRGVHALMGGLRWQGGPVVDSVTRLAGLAIRRDPPQGILDMWPGPGGYLAGLKHRPLQSTLAFAGAVKKEGADAYGFLSGFADELLSDGSHDLVVPTRSAINGPTGSGTTVPCDHFSYLENRTVLTAIRKAVEPLAPMVPDVIRH